jgi:ribosomal protein S18 acetylase RimI-like enzyme
MASRVRQPRCQGCLSLRSQDAARDSGHHLQMTAQLDPVRVLIRPATSADRDTIVSFRLAMFADMFAGEPRAEDPPRVDLEALREANERWVGEHFGRDFISWLAELDGAPVASAGLLWFAHPPGPVSPAGLEAYILNVYTKPEARRLGLAKALASRAVDEARAKGVRRIWLRASDDGRPLYEAIGFRTGRYLELTPDGD